MTRQWRDTKYSKGAAPYYIRGVEFVGGVSQAEVPQSVAEFFAAIGVIQEDVPGFEPPVPASVVKEMVEKAGETPADTPVPEEVAPEAPKRTRKK